MPGTITELPHKTRKKPPKSPDPPVKATETFVKPSTEPFPQWPKGSGKGGFSKPAEMMEYWQSLPPEFIARTNFYVNREHPKLDQLRELSDEQREEIRQKKRKYPKKYIDKPGEPWDDLPDIRMAILRRYGSGDYKLFLNDCGVQTKEALAKKDPDLSSRNLCRCLVSFWDPEYPPILDPSRPDKGIGILDWSHPANASYIADLRMRGLTPPNEKEEEMPNDVVKTLVEKVGTLADKVAAHETDRLVDRIAEKVNPAQGSAASSIVEVMKAAKELNTPAPGTADTGMNGMLALFQTMMTMKADNPMADIYKAEMQNLRDEMKAEREENRKLQREMREAAEKKQAGDGGFESMIDRVEKLAPKLSSLLGLGGDKLTDVVHGRRRPIWEELALQTLPPLAQGLSPILPMLAQRFLVGPPPSNGITPPAPNGTQAALPPGQSQAPAAGSIQEVQIRVAQYLTVNLMPMRKAFEGFLKADWRDEDHHEDGHVDGSDFADWIFENHGDAILKDARMLGSGNILAMFKGGPLWPQLAPHEAKLAEFLDQCLRYEPPPPEAEENAVVVAEEK